MGNLMKDESYYSLYDTLSRGIIDYSCSDFIGKAEMLFHTLDDIKTMINDKIPLVWTDQVQVEIGEKTTTSLSQSIINAKSYVDDVITPLVSSNYVEDLKNKLKLYIDAYNLYYEQYKNVKIDDEEFERNKPPIPLAKDYEGGINNEAYKKAYETYKEYVADFQKIYDAVTKSENFVRKKHSECEDLISKINNILNKTAGESASAKTPAPATSTATSPSEGELTEELSEMIDENGNKHVKTTMKDVNGNVVSTVEEVTDKNGNIISTLKTEYYENGKTKNIHYDDKVGHGDYNEEYDVQGRKTRIHVERKELSDGKIYEDYDIEYLYDENTQVKNIGKITYADGSKRVDYYQKEVDGSIVDWGYSESYNADGTLITKEYKEVTEGDVTIITTAAKYNDDGTLYYEGYRRENGKTYGIAYYDTMYEKGAKYEKYKSGFENDAIIESFDVKYNNDGSVVKGYSREDGGREFGKITIDEMCDANGNVTKSKYSKKWSGDSSGIKSINIQTEYELLSDGSAIKNSEEKIVDGKLTTYTFKSKCDANGEMIIEGYEDTYSYDENGHVTIDNTILSEQTSEGYHNEAIHRTYVDDKMVSEAVYFYNAKDDDINNHEYRKYQANYTYDKNGVQTAEIQAEHHRNDSGMQENNVLETRVDGKTVSKSFEKSINSEGKVECENYTAKYTVENGKEKVVSHADSVTLDDGSRLTNVDEVIVDGKKTSHKFEKYYDREGYLYEENGEIKWKYSDNGITMDFRCKEYQDYKYKEGYTQVCPTHAVVTYKDEEEMNSSAFTKGEISKYR